MNLPIQVQAQECIVNWDIKGSKYEDVECYNILARGAAQVLKSYIEMQKQNISNCKFNTQFPELIPVASKRFWHIGQAVKLV